MNGKIGSFDCRMVNIRRFRSRARWSEVSGLDWKVVVSVGEWGDPNFLDQSRISGRFDLQKFQDQVESPEISGSE